MEEQMSGLLTTLVWIHLLSAVIWVGGIIFILFIAIPSTKQILGAEAAKLMGEVSRRFTPYANYSILFLIVTGVLLGFLKGHFSIFNSSRDSLAVYLKSLVAFGMISIHFYRGLILSPKIVKTVTLEEKAALQKLSLNMVKLNLILGVMVLLIAGYVKT